MNVTDIPSSTYRLQFCSDFGFSESSELTEYFKELGIGAVYSSPLFEAVPGSAHGYDITDPNSINPELGTPAELKRIVKSFKKQGIGWIQDIVPNHQAYTSRNRIIADIFERGNNSGFFHFPDVDWEHPYIRGRLLAPFLGKPFGEALENGEIKLGYKRSGFYIQYYEHIFPLKAETYVKVLSHGLKDPVKQHGNEPDITNLFNIIRMFRGIHSSPGNKDRHDTLSEAKEALWRLYKERGFVKDFINRNIEELNGIKGNSDSFNHLETLLAEQNFKLSYWKVATEEINYRRFFNINELICMRTEDPAVMEYNHKLIFSLVNEGLFTGLRVDHVDGLYDPFHYLQRLKKNTGNIYVLVEKILETDERLREDWQVEGTTGYDFLNHVNGLFCKRENAGEFTKLYTSFTGTKTDYRELLYEKKKMIIEKHLGGDIDNLIRLLKKVSGTDRYGSDITANGLKRALTEVASAFPVYRTYIRNSDISKEDRNIIIRAVKQTKDRNPDLFPEIGYLEKFLLFESFDSAPEDRKEMWADFVMRFQQLTGPLMAKGFEDTTLYIYNRILSLNEVGGDPGRFGTGVKEFHEFNETRLSDHPYAMNATSTHDSKRGEDIRARINVLSEMPGEWRERLRTWSRMNSSKKGRRGRRLVPEKNDEYFLYQSMLGGLPFEQEKYEEFRERLSNYMIKAVREAKVNTAWLEPDTDYEDAFVGFIDRITDFSGEDEFTNDFLKFQKKIARFGITNSLSQTLLKMTSPGVPDFYQGTELWDLNFVDPDNRRPVDFGKRKMFLEQIIKNDDTSGQTAFIRELVNSGEDGRIKMYLIRKTLEYRKRRRDLFMHGSYTPLRSCGEFPGNILSFVRSSGKDCFITLVTRFPSELPVYEGMPLGEAVWKDTTVSIPGGYPRTYRNVLTGETVEADVNGLSAADVFREIPVALLHGGSET